MLDPSSRCKRKQTVKEIMSNEFVFVVHLMHRRGLVATIPVYRSRGPGSIPSTTTFSEKQWVWNGVHSVLWLQLRSHLEEKVAALV
jgi:hypothetical protein